MAAILARTVRHPDTGCLLWLGARTRPDGYGKAEVDGVTRLVHRAACEARYGASLGRLEACHSPACESLPGMVVGRAYHPKPGRLCCNPAHLTPGTRSENARHRERAKRRHCDR